MDTLLLPVELKERRAVLEEELRKVITDQCFQGVRHELKELFKGDAFNEENVPQKLSWTFYPEGDDEGGVVWYPTGVWLEGTNGSIDMEDIDVTVKSKYSESYYDTSLQDMVYEILHDYRDDLYQYNIEEIYL